MEKYCPFCGSPYKDGDKFCEVCGSRIQAGNEGFYDDDTVRIGPDTPPEVLASLGIVGGQAAPDAASLKPKKNAAKIIAPIVASVAAAAVITVLFIFPGYLKPILGIGKAAESETAEEIAEVVSDSVIESEEITETESETERETETEPETEQVMVDVSEYLGYWYYSGDFDRELNIKKIEGDTVFFDYFIDPDFEMNNVQARISGNRAEFDHKVGTGYVEGNLLFDGDRVGLSITNSDVPNAVPVGSRFFNEKYSNTKIVPPETEPETEPEPVSAWERTPYNVRVKVTELMMREGPGTNYPRRGTEFVTPGVHKIVQFSVGEGSANGWGRLENGGWIALDYAEIVN